MDASGSPAPPEIVTTRSMARKWIDTSLGIIASIGMSLHISATLTVLFLLCRDDRGWTALPESYPQEALYLIFKNGTNDCLSRDLINAPRLPRKDA
jgi:hypothetical protein